MSAELRGEYEVLALIRSCIIEGLKTYGIDSGIDVRMFAQANFNHGDKLVLLNLINTKRCGRQMTDYVGGNTNDVYSRRDSWIEERTYQVSVMKKMNKDDDENTVTAEDISMRLISWFNGLGLDWLRENGLSCYPIDPNSIIVYNDDSDLYQRRPVFAVTVIVNKSFKLAQPDIKIIGVVTKPI